METSTLRQSLLTHHADPRTRGEWALSVAALPSKTPAEIVAAATFIKHGVVRTAVAADLVDAGYAVVEDGLPHSLIVFNDEPSPGTLLELKAMFKNEVPNPYAKDLMQRSGEAVTIGSRNHVFPIDLNSVRADEVGTLLTLASDPIAAQLDPPMPGDEVYALDEEGYQYVAVVADRDGIWLSLTIRWSTAIPPIDMKQRVGVQPFSIGRKTPTYSGRESG